MEPVTLKRVPAEKADLKGRLYGRRTWLALAGLALAAALLVDISLEQPRVHIRWRDGVTGEERVALEQRYRLLDGEPVDGTTWRYDLRDRSTGNIGAIVTSSFTW